MAYLGSTPETQTFTSGTDYFNGDGISVSFTLSRPVASVNDIDVVVSNVVQQPSTAYSVSGTTITFTSAPPAGTSNVYARYLSTATQTLTPSPGTVGTSQFSPSLTNVPFFGGSTLGAGNATGMKNRLINGGMVIDQRATALTDYGYATDRWSYNPAAASKATVAQSSVAPTGFTYSLLATSSAATTVSSTDVYILEQKIEGYNVADLAFGTASAKTVTVSFWVRSSLTGTFSGALGNAGPDRSYPFSYTISSANTWEQKTVVIPGDTTGTWATTNGAAFRLCFSLGCGSSRSASAGAWTGTANVFAASSTVNLVETSGATFYVTGVQLEEGNAATSFDFRDYGRELALCQRYYYVLAPKAANQPTGLASYYNNTYLATNVSFPTTMRSSPTAISASGADYFIVFRDNSSDSFDSWTYDASAVSPQVAEIYNSTEISGTAGQVGTTRTNNASAFVHFTAEL